MSQSFIPLSVPNLGGKELAYVTEAVASGWVSTAGAYVGEFEKALAGYVGMPGAVACQSGTAGLHLALQACGVARGDLVVVPTLTFIAAVNPVRYLGADPVFMDCDDGLCMDPAKLRAFCRERCELRGGVLFHKASGRRVPAVVVVHVFGNMADMPAILAVAADYGLAVVEDATEALGTRYEGGAFAGTMGTVGVYSFNGNKIATTGGGGMVVSRDAALLGHVRHLGTQAKSDPESFLHDEVGYNYRMTNLQAALGLAQIGRIEEFVAAKVRNYGRYRAAGLDLLPFREGVRSNRWFYSLPVDGNDPMEVVGRLKAEGVQARPIWGLVHEQVPYVGCEAYEVELAPRYRGRIVNIPCGTGLTDGDVDRVVAALRAVL